MKNTGAVLNIESGDYKFNFKVERDNIGFVCILTQTTSFKNTEGLEDEDDFITTFKCVCHH